MHAHRPTLESTGKSGFLLEFIFFATSSNMDHSLHGVDTREGSKLQGTTNYAMWSLKIGIALQDELLWHLFEPSSPEAIGSQAIPAASEVATSSATSRVVPGAIH